MDDDVAKRDAHIRELCVMAQKADVNTDAIWLARRIDDVIAYKPELIVLNRQGFNSQSILLLHSTLQ